MAELIMDATATECFMIMETEGKKLAFIGTIKPAVCNSDDSLL